MAYARQYFDRYVANSSDKIEHRLRIMRPQIGRELANSCEVCAFGAALSPLYGHSLLQRDRVDLQQARDVGCTG
jgi:hypothetical protein